MPDLLAHALIAYSVCTALSWQYDWLSREYVTVGVVGAFVPDLTKVRLLVPSDLVTAVLGDISFAWGGLHTLGGTALSVLVGVVVVAPEERRRVLGLLALGAATHHLADGLLQTATGRSYAMFWPVSRVHPSTPGLYLSTQPEPTVVAVVLAAAVWSAMRVHDREDTGPSVNRDEKK